MRSVESKPNTCARPGGARSISTLREAMQHTMEGGAGIYRTRASLAEAAGKIAEMQERYKAISMEDHSLDLQHAAGCGAGAGLPARRRRDHPPMRPAARGVARRPSTDRFPRSRRQEIPGAFAGVAEHGWAAAGRLSAGNDHTLAAGQAGIRRAIDRWRTRSVIEVARYSPESDAEPHFQNYRGSAARGLDGPRRAELYQGQARRLAHLPLVVPDGYLRQLRHDGQRRTEADLRDPARAVCARPGAGRAVAPFPDRRATS